MEISKIINKRLVVFTLLCLFTIGLGWRLAPHMPNFAPIGAIVLFGSVLLGWRITLWLLIAILLFSDIVIGFYAGIEWTWLGFGLIIVIGNIIKRTPLLWRIPVGALGSSIVFFIVSNFGTWVASGMYSHDIAGLIQCYTMGLPFFRVTVLSDVFFYSVFLGVYKVVVYYKYKRYSFVPAKTPLIN